MPIIPVMRVTREVSSDLFYAIFANHADTYSQALLQQILYVIRSHTERGETLWEQGYLSGTYQKVYLVSKQDMDSMGLSHVLLMLLRELEIKRLSGRITDTGDMNNDVEYVPLSRGCTYWIGDSRARFARALLACLINWGNIAGTIDGEVVPYFYVEHGEYGTYITFSRPIVATQLATDRFPLVLQVVPVNDTAYSTVRIAPSILPSTYYPVPPPPPPTVSTTSETAPQHLTDTGGTFTGPVMSWAQRCVTVDRQRAWVVLDDYLPVYDSDVVQEYNAHPVRMRYIRGDRVLFAYDGEMHFGTIRSKYKSTKTGNWCYNIYGDPGPTGMGTLLHSYTVRANLVVGGACDTCGSPFDLRPHGECGTICETCEKNLCQS